MSTAKGVAQRLAPIEEGSVRSGVSSVVEGDVDVEEVSTADMTHISASVLEDLPGIHSVVPPTHHHVMSFERMADWVSTHRPLTPLNTANAGVFAFFRILLRGV